MLSKNITHCAISLELDIAEPLWQRVPIRTESGELAADFMMILKQLNKSKQQQQEKILTNIYQILHIYSKVILFADVNVNMNLLWVSHVPRPGLGLEIAAQIHNVVPEAKLVSHQFRE